MDLEKYTQKSKDFFIGIDSDGTVFDSMTLKHTFSFIPAAIKVFELEEYKEISAIHKDTKGLMVKLDPDDEDIEKSVEFAKDCDIIILGMCSAIIFKNQVKLYDELKKLGKTIIVVAMESPYDIELIPDCKNYIATYGAARDWMKVAALRIFGKTNINAKSPITINY